MATPRKSRLDESLADRVTDETDAAARIAGHSATAEDHAEARAARDEKIALYVKEHQVPKAVAEIMADLGYSKGTANRILLDRAKAAARKREAAAGVTA